MEKCRDCGFLINDGWFLCPKCGKKISSGNISSDLEKNHDTFNEFKVHNTFKSVYDVLSSRIAILSEEEKESLKNNFSFFSTFDEDQRKAIVIDKKRLLCIAGAGSGKTTVLTKKIEFLIKYQDVDPKYILAITFTRKAAQELKDRLKGIADLATITTFNAFCESNLIEYEHLYYSLPQRMISEDDSKKLLKHCVNELGIDVPSLIKDYFDVIIGNADSKKDENLLEYYNQFIDDVLSLIDYVKNEDLSIKYLEDSIAFILDYKQKQIALLIYNIISLYEKKKKYVGLRDYADQVSHFYDVLRTKSQIKKKISQKYKYIFIDEYQDVNAIQVKLLDEILTDNSYLFVVGDPRQSIFGFRGSDINYILNFVKKYSDSQIVFLNINYRSKKEILDMANKSIEILGLPNLKSVHKQETETEHLKEKKDENKESGKRAYLIQCENKEKEAEFVSLHIKRLLKEKISPGDILILARTNFQIDFLIEQFKSKEIPFVRKSIDMPDKQKQDSKKVVVSTIHAIKGLEAKIVFVIGLVPGIFPSISKEKQILQELKRQSFTDSYDEELRLFYVAITRAKERLFLTHYSKAKKTTSNPFFTKEILDLLKLDKY